MWDKARKILYRGGEILELLMAAAVVAGILVAMITLVPELARYWEHRTMTGAFMEYLDAVFNVVIGIEFLKMLCKPSSANIIEVLIFLIARHMIVQTTTPLEDLLSICILFFFRRFMLMTKPDKDQNVPKLFGVIKASQSGRPVQTERADAEKAEGSEGTVEK